MSQVKIYGLKSHLNSLKTELSSTIHRTVVKELSSPKEKKYHRFIALDVEDILFPDVKSEAYTIIEIMMIEGRSVETKKRLIYALFKNIEDDLGICKTDIEICIVESPACNWGFGGKTGDDIKLNYKIEI